MEEAHYFLDLLKEYWNHLNTLILDAVAPDAPVAAEGNYLIDVDQHDFEDEEDPELALTAALCEWAKGFITATEHWATHWESVRARPELAASWKVLRCWADLTEPGNWDKRSTARVFLRQTQRKNVYKHWPHSPTRTTPICSDPVVCKVQRSPSISSHPRFSPQPRFPSITRTHSA